MFFYLYKNVIVSIFIYIIHNLHFFIFIPHTNRTLHFFTFSNPRKPLLNKFLTYVISISLANRIKNRPFLPFSGNFYTDPIQKFLNMKKAPLVRSLFISIAVISGSDRRNDGRVHCSFHDHGHDDVCILLLH